MAALRPSATSPSLRHSEVLEAKQIDEQEVDEEVGRQLRAGMAAQEVRRGRRILVRWLEAPYSLASSISYRFQLFGDARLHAG